MKTAIVARQHPKTSRAKSSSIKRGVLLDGFVLTHTSHSLQAILHRIQKGIPIAEFETTMARLGLTQEDLARKIGISIPTLSRRKKAAQPLDPEHSDRLLRFERIFGKAVALFDGNEANARSWLNRPDPSLGDLTPLIAAETEIGAREVENFIGRLEYGELT